MGFFLSITGYKLASFFMNLTDVSPQGLRCTELTREELWLQDFRYNLNDMFILIKHQVQNSFDNIFHYIVCFETLSLHLFNAFTLTLRLGHCRRRHLCLNRTRLNVFVYDPYTYFRLLLKHYLHSIQSTRMLQGLQLPTLHFLRLLIVLV